MNTRLERISTRYIETPGGCWQWIGRIDRDGYGRYGKGMAHRELLIALDRAKTARYNTRRLARDAQ